MSVPALTIADAVVDALNGATLSQSVTFARVYVPKFDVADAATVQGKVVPKSDTREMGSAADDSVTVMIDIGIMKRLQDAIAGEVAEVDAILELCEEIKAALNRQRLDGAEDAVCLGVAQPVLYAVDELDNARVFLTVLTATFLTSVDA